MGASVEDLGGAVMSGIRRSGTMDALRTLLEAVVRTVA